jgi:hypothetical protein
MTATVETPIDDVTAEVNTEESADIFERANETFKDLSLWMLQRYATADVNDDVNADLMLPKSIVESAKEIMTLRIEEGEELKHDILTGVLGQVNGMCQCFIDTRNTLNEVAENPKVTRNKIINALVKNPSQRLGLKSASVLSKQEYGFDKTDLYPTKSKFIERYVDGHLQSGAMELGLGATWDKAHYVVVSSVQDESECAVTAIFPCYDLQGASAKGV